MSNEAQERTPTEIQLHQKSHILSINFADGKRFELPCEYLRVFSKAAEVRVMPEPITGKEDVSIVKVEPVGHYAVRLYFDDGHDTGVYSWDTLYELGENQERHWAEYLRRLEEIGYQRKSPADGSDQASKRQITVLYFVYLVKAFGKDYEELELPETIHDVAGLLQWLRRRGKEWSRFLVPENIQVTVNKQFSESFTKLEDGDEVAIVPTRPQPPDVF